MNQPSMTSAEKFIGWTFGLMLAFWGLAVAATTHWSALLWFGAAAALLLPPVRERVHRMTGSTVPGGGRAVAVIALFVGGMAFPAVMGVRAAEQAQTVAREERIAARRAERTAEFQDKRAALLGRLQEATNPEQLKEAVGAFDPYRDVADDDAEAVLNAASSRLQALVDQARSDEILLELRSVSAQEYARNHMLYAELVRMHPENPQYAERETFYKGRAAAEASRSANANRLAGLWSYSADGDSMTGKISRFASIRSRNTVEFDFPYNGPQRATLTFRDHASHGADAIVRIERGQLLCRSYEDCTIRVRFGDGAPRAWRAIGPSDNSSEVIFLRNQGDFRNRMQKVDMVRVEVPVYQEGNQVFEFEVGGFDAKRYGALK